MRKRQDKCKKKVLCSTDLAKIFCENAACTLYQICAIVAKDVIVILSETKTSCVHGGTYDFVIVAVDAAQVRQVELEVFASMCVGSSVSFRHASTGAAVVAPCCAGNWCFVPADAVFTGTVDDKHVVEGDLLHRVRLDVLCRFRP